MPSTRLIVRGAPLPVSFKGDLNKLWSAMLDRLEVLSPFGEVQLQIGGLQPTSNKGPWFKDGSQLWVWDEATKTYIPLDITASLGPVTDAIAAALTAAHTQITTELTAAIAAAITAIPVPVSAGAHFSASQTSMLTTGSMTNGGEVVDIPLDHIEVDTESGFSPGVYTVKKAGFYSITVVWQTEGSSGSALNISIVGKISANGGGVLAQTGLGNTNSNIFAATYQGQFAVGDRLSTSVEFDVNGGPIAMKVVTTRFSGFLTP